jgi:hypothetical protein
VTNKTNISGLFVISKKNCLRKKIRKRVAKGEEKEPGLSDNTYFLFKHKPIEGYYLRFD